MDRSNEAPEIIGRPVRAGHPDAAEFITQALRLFPRRTGWRRRNPSSATCARPRLPCRCLPPSTSATFLSHRRSSMNLQSLKPHRHPVCVPRIPGTASERKKKARGRSAKNSIAASRPSKKVATPSGCTLPGNRRLMGVLVVAPPLLLAARATLGSSRPRLHACTWGAVGVR